MLGDPLLALVYKVYKVTTLTGVDGLDHYQSKKFIFIFITWIVGSGGTWWGLGLWATKKTWNGGMGGDKQGIGPLGENTEGENNLLRCAGELAHTSHRVSRSQVSDEWFDGWEYSSKGSTGPGKTQPWGSMTRKPRVPSSHLNLHNYPNLRHKQTRHFAMKHSLVHSVFKPSTRRTSTMDGRPVCWWPRILTMTCLPRQGAWVYLHAWFYPWGMFSYYGLQVNENGFRRKVGNVRGTNQIMPKLPPARRNPDQSTTSG